MKIALIGYGKMGRMIEQVARERGHEIAAVIDRDNQSDFDSPAFARADVAIEFTTPGSAYANCCRAWQAGVKVVSGSTGWRAEHDADVRRACLEEGKTLFWASNFSIGVALFDALARRAAELMNRFGQYDVAIEEVHHTHKLDAPSGTAITLAETLIAGLDRKRAWAPAAEAADRPDIVAVAASRRGEVPGIHRILFDSPEDSITLTHDAHSRRGFALGAVVAAEFTATRSGLLTMADLLDF